MATIKQLVWEEERKPGLHHWIARNPFGQVFECITSHGSWYSSWRLPSPENQFNRLEEAQAEAQRAYEAVMRNCLA